MNPCACDEDCGRYVTVSAFGPAGSGIHASCRSRDRRRALRAGETRLPGYRARTGQVSYNSAHARVRSIRGLARENECVDCFKMADHWSYDHNSDQEQEGWKNPYMQSGSWVYWSSNPEDYSPRCASCHKKYDLFVIGERFPEKCCAHCKVA